MEIYVTLWDIHKNWNWEDQEVKLTLDELKMFLPDDLI